MTVTIQDLKAFGQSAGGGDQKSFEGLHATVKSAEPPKQGEYGQMQRVQLQDATGSWYFSAMDCPDLHQGQVIIASGRVKGNQGKKPYFNLLSVQEGGGGSAPPPQQAGFTPAAAPPRQQQGGQPAPAGKPDYSVGTVADRVDLLLRTFDALAAGLYATLAPRYGEGSAKATLVEPAVVAQLVATASGVGQGWEKGQLRWQPGQPLGGPPYYQDGQAPDDPDVPW